MNIDGHEGTARREGEIVERVFAMFPAEGQSKKESRNATRN
jgi:hypothetical protein